jgi:hypothetical protein
MVTNMVSKVFDTHQIRSSYKLLTGSLLIFITLHYIQTSMTGTSSVARKTVSVIDAFLLHEHLYQCWEDCVAEKSCRLWEYRLSTFDCILQKLP